MIDPIWRYMEYGKFFSQRGASEFYELACTTGIGKRSYSLRQILSFPNKTTFANQLKAVSLACFLVSPTEFVFAHIQRRRENEMNANAPLARWFNQIRFTLLQVDELYAFFQKGCAVFYELLHEHPLREHPNSPPSPYFLTDYPNIVGLQEQRPMVLDSQPGESRSLMYRLTQPGPMGQQSDTLERQIKAIARKVIESEDGTQHVRVICPGLGFETKLLLAQAVQRLLFPLTGPLSFALGYVTDPLRPVRLQFISNPDEHIPQRVDPIFVNLDQAPSFAAGEPSAGSAALYVNLAFDLFEQNSWETANQALFDDFVGRIIQDRDYARAFRSAPLLYSSASDYIVTTYDIQDYLSKEEQTEGITSRLPHMNTIELGQLLQGDTGVWVLERTLTRLSLSDWLSKLFTVKSQTYEYKHFELLLDKISLHKNDLGSLQECTAIVSSHTQAWQHLFEISQKEYKNAVLASVADQDLIKAFIELLVGVVVQDLDFACWFLFHEFSKARIQQSELCNYYSRMIQALSGNRRVVQRRQPLGFLANPRDHPDDSFRDILSEHPKLFHCAIHNCLARGQPVPLDDLQFLISNVRENEHYSEFLTRIARNWDAQYADLDSSLALQWLHLVSASGTRESYHDRGRDKLYDFAGSLKIPTPALIEQMLEEILELPDVYDKTSEYACWVTKAQSTDLSELPNLALLADSPTSVYSYWEATQSILVSDELFLIAVQHAVAHRRSLPTDDIKALVRLDSAGNADAAQVLHQALAANTVVQSLVRDLLEDRDPAAWGTLLKIVQDNKWADYLQRLSESDALYWLEAIPSEQRQEYYLEGRDRLYDIAFSTISESLQLALRVLQEIPSLPPRYNQDAEYTVWMDKAHELLPQEELPSHLLFLLGERPDGVQSYWDATQRILDNGNEDLFLIAVRYAVAHRSVIPTADIKILVRKETVGDAGVPEILEGALVANVVPQFFVRELLGEIGAG